MQTWQNCRKAASPTTVA